MLPARFDYIAASSVEEAVAAKAEGGDEARFLAGGQSLLPMMKLRLAVPAMLVDINRIDGLGTIERHNGHLHVGALVRHADIVASGAVSGAVASAAPWISDPLVRNLGTMCGSVAHCDPEGDWNSVLLATGANVIAQGALRVAQHRHRRLRAGLLHHLPQRRRDGDRRSHPGSLGTIRRPPTRNWSARSATMRRWAWPPTWSSPATAPSALRAWP